MLKLKVTSDLASVLIGRLEKQFSELADLTPLASKIAQMMRVEKSLATHAGLDRYGEPFAPLNRGLPLKDWQRRKRGGDGPPLAPKHSHSRVAMFFEVVVNRPTPYQWFIIGSWPGLYWLKYHSAGPYHSFHLPVRDVFGLSAAVNQEIVDMAHDYVVEVMNKG
jgi:phage gpG-like protein